MKRIMKQTKVCMLMLVLFVHICLGFVYAQNRESDFIAEVTRDGRGVVIVKYVGDTTDVIIPTTIEGMPVRELGDEMFSANSQIASVVIPEGITSLQGGYRTGTFCGCAKLTSVSLPESLTYIGGYAFSGCSSITSISLPKGLTSIGESAFSGCSSLTTITIPNNIKSIGGYAFAWSGLTSITWPSIHSVPEGAFKSCQNLVSAVIPEGVRNIETDAFFYCEALTSITLPSTIRNIGAQAFTNCYSLVNIIIPDSVSYISFESLFGDPIFGSCVRLNLASQAALRRVGYTGRFK